MANKTLREVVEADGRLLVLPERTPVEAEPVGERINMVYNVKAHYRDGVAWDEGERETLFGIFDEGLESRNMDVDFVSIGRRSLYLEGVTIDTVGGNTIDQFRLCSGECKGHDYLRQVQFFKKKQDTK